MDNNKIVETQIFKTNGRLVRYGHTYEDKCIVHYSTVGKIADAQITWSSNPKCGERTHRKQPVWNKP